MKRTLASLAAALSAVVFAAPASAQLPPITHGDISIMLDPIATGMAAPDYAINAPGDPTRLFVVEQNGLLRVIQNGTLQPGAALDIGPSMAGQFNAGNANEERGFLGLAFHPGYANPLSPGHRTLYTYSTAPLAGQPLPTYSAPQGASQAYKLVINEWKMDATNPALVDASSRREIMSFGKNATNHNGGTIAFGPDGYMYLAIGDGGNANDVGASHNPAIGNSQDVTTPLGKMIRIDPTNPSLTTGSPNAVSGNGQYRIPADNPNMGAGAIPEMWAMGLRNPYRFAFDDRVGGTGDLILADVGQNNIEEIDRIIKGGNYGWAIKEGTFLFNRTTATGTPGTIGANSPGSPAGLIDPIQGTTGNYLQYDHGDGISITGGFVYRGAGISELFGKYVFGDLAIRGGPRVDGRLFYADLEDGTLHEFVLPFMASTAFPNGQLPNGLTVHGFGQDAAGELYALVTNTPANGTGGIVYKIVAVVPEPSSMALIGFAVLALVRRRRATT